MTDRWFKKIDEFRFIGFWIEDCLHSQRGGPPRFTREWYKNNKVPFPTPWIRSQQLDTVLSNTLHDFFVDHQAIRSLENACFNFGDRDSFELLANICLDGWND